MADVADSDLPQFMEGRYDIFEKNTFLDFPAPKPLMLEKAQTDPPPGLEGLCGISSKFVSETDRSEDSTAVDEMEAAPPPLPLEVFVTPDCFEDPEFSRPLSAAAPTFIPIPGAGAAGALGALPMHGLANLPGIPDAFVGPSIPELCRPKTQILLEEMLAPSVVPVTELATSRFPPPPPAMPAPVLAEPPSPEVPAEAPVEGPLPPRCDLQVGQLVCEEPARGIWDVHWSADSRQLYTTTVRLVSGIFMLQVKGSSLPFKVFLHPKVVINNKRGGGFKKAKGKGSIVLKCEAEDVKRYPKLDISFRVGRGSRLQPPRSVEAHDFGEQSCCCLPEAQQEWDFRSLVDESGSLLVSLRIAADPAKVGKIRPVKHGEAEFAMSSECKPTKWQQRVRNHVIKDDGSEMHISTYAEPLPFLRGLASFGLRKHRAVDFELLELAAKDASAVSGMALVRQALSWGERSIKRPCCELGGACIASRLKFLPSAESQLEACTEGFSYSCSEGYVLKSNFHEITGSSDSECCQPTCALWSCTGHFVANDAYKGNTGSSNEQCCDQTCAAVTCPKDQKVPLELRDSAGRTPKDCCKDTCAAVVCEPFHVPIRANLHSVYPDGEDQSFCCEPTCGAYTCDYRKGLVLDRAKQMVPNPSDGTCCTATCSKTACPAGFETRPENANKDAREVECCEPLCSSHSCSSGWVPDESRAQRVGNTDQECCRRTCKEYTCSAGWATNPAAANEIGVDDETCCSKTCAQFQEQCTGDYAPNGAKNNTVGHTAETCCSKTCALYSCGAGVVIPKSQSVVGSSDELCCENSRCPAMRKMTKLDNGKHCSSLSEDVCSKHFVELKNSITNKMDALACKMMTDIGQEGGESEEDLAPIAVGVAPPGPAVVAALNNTLREKAVTFLLLPPAWLKFSEYWSSCRGCCETSCMRLGNRKFFAAVSSMADSLARSCAHAERLLPIDDIDDVGDVLQGRGVLKKGSVQMMFEFLAVRLKARLFLHDFLGRRSSPQEGNRRAVPIAPRRSLQPDVLDFDVESWLHWRQLRAKFMQVKQQEASLQQATDTARTAWMEQLHAGSRRPDGSRRTFLRFQSAVELANLAKFAAKEVLPSPADFFRSRQLWPPSAGRHDDSPERPVMEELSETFLYIALEKWLGRLLEESRKVVPAAAAAARATEDMSRHCKAPTREALASQRQTEEEVHPSALLQHLPGGPPAVKSVLLAKHRARSMKLQADLMKLCCGRSTPARASLLDEAREALARALKLLRLAEALCCERRKLRSFWPLPDDSSSHAPVDANDDGGGSSFPAEQRSRWLPASCREQVKEHLASARDLVPGLDLPPEALFCWTVADMEMFFASSGYVKPKLRLLYYISPECPQTIVDLVSPSLRRQNWACTVRPEPGNTPIFVWEGSRPSIDPSPTLSRGGLVNRVAPVLPITRKVGMLRALQKWCSGRRQEFPPPWYPVTFELPTSLEEWKQHVSQHPAKRWIYKPNG
ncbi:Ttll1, partial [Symbiodinium necroappetens]